MMSRARDLFSSSRVRALGEQKGGGLKYGTPAGVHTPTGGLLDGIVHGFADVQHGVEDDGVPGQLHLVPAGDKRFL